MIAVQSSPSIEPRGRMGCTGGAAYGRYRRRRFRANLAGIGVVLLSLTAARAEPPALDLLKLPVVDPELVKIRAVTHGPKYHWFGYYDKFQIDTSGRYLLVHQVDFEHRAPKPDDVIKIGMIDLADNDRWIELAETRAWSWQQGSMLQWRPGFDDQIVFNDRDGDRFVCRVLDVKTRELRALPMAIDYLSADGKLALCCDYRRIQHIRTGYGYVGVEDPNKDKLAPDDTGVFRMDMETGRTRLLVSVAALAAIPYPGSTPKDNHYVNHVQISPDGQRFFVFDRWVGGLRGQPTRVFAANVADGGELRLLSAEGASHYMWDDAQNVLIWGNGSYSLYADDGSGRPHKTLWKAPNGHHSFIPGTNHQWLVTDTYPQGPKREQIVYLFHRPTERAFVLGRFAAPRAYSADLRCDTHPRVSRDGRFVIIDSPHGGEGRQQYLIDISRIVEGERISPAAENAGRASRPAE